MRSGRRSGLVAVWCVECEPAARAGVETRREVNRLADGLFGPAGGWRISHAPKATGGRKLIPDSPAGSNPALPSARPRNAVPARASGLGTPGTGAGRFRKSMDWRNPT
jgi:hypothetical protein